MTSRSEIQTVPVLLTHADESRSLRQVPYTPTAINGLVITPWHELDEDGQAVQAPRLYTLTHLRTVFVRCCAESAIGDRRGFSVGRNYMG